jgi:hypothetical protein
MKMGTIRSLCRYDEASKSATNLAGVAATGRLGAVNDGLQLIDDASHAVQELAAGWRRPRAAVGSLEQPHAQQPLDTPAASAEIGLREPEHISSLSEAVVTRGHLSVA